MSCCATAKPTPRPWLFGTIGAARGNAGHPQHRDDIEIVSLERNRKCEDVELAQRACLLERNEALVAFAQRPVDICAPFTLNQPRNKSDIKPLAKPVWFTVG